MGKYRYGCLRRLVSGRVVDVRHTLRHHVKAAAATSGVGTAGSSLIETANKASLLQEFMLLLLLLLLLLLVVCEELLLLLLLPLDV